MRRIQLVLDGREWSGADDLEAIAEVVRATGREIRPPVEDEQADDGERLCCEECGEPIAPARLKALPEVTTCVRCQDRIEREDKRADEVEALFGAEEEDE